MQPMEMVSLAPRIRWESAEASAVAVNCRRFVVISHLPFQDTLLAGMLGSRLARNGGEDGDGEDDEAHPEQVGDEKVGELSPQGGE